MRILKFFTKNCLACKNADEVLKDVASATSVEVESVDCEMNPGLAKQYRIMTVPVIIILNESNNPVARIQWKDINHNNLISFITLTK